MLLLLCLSVHKTLQAGCDVSGLTPCHLSTRFLCHKGWRRSQGFPSKLGQGSRQSVNTANARHRGRLDLLGAGNFETLG